MLPAFKQYLLSLKLSAVSRKLYFADVKNFFNYLGDNPTLDQLVSAKIYRSYLENLRSQAIAPSMLKRTIASLRQFGSFLSSAHGVTSPLIALHSTDQSTEMLSDKYIKHFTKYLISEQLSPLTIKSYKSDIARYLEWVGVGLTSNNASQLLSQKNIEKYLNYLSESKLALPSTIERKFKSIERFKAWYSTSYPSPIISNNNQSHIFNDLNVFADQLTSQPIVTPDKDLISVKKINSRRWGFGSIASFAILLLFVATLSVFSYRQFSRDVRLTAAYPTTPVTPNRQLSFQGRLEDAGGTPITSATNFVFKLWDDPSAGSQLYTSGTCAITPDADGVFNTQIGDTCGAGISSSVFTENADVYLEVTVAAEVLTPRQQIATVAYALNSETIQGFPISATVSAIRNTVVPMNQWGEIIVGEQSPRLKGVSGTFQISAPALSLITTAGSNGNISIAPDGTGQVNLTGNTTTTNFFNVSNAQLTTGSLITGTVANNNSGFKLIDLLSGSSPTSKFSVTNAGNTTIAGDLTITGDDLFMNTNTSGFILVADGTNYNPVAMSGDVTINSAGTTAIGSSKVTEDMLKLINSPTDELCLTYETDSGGDFAWQTCSTGDGSSNWRINLGTISPNNDTLDLLVGANATASAKAGFVNINSGTPTATVSAGTAGAATLTATGTLGTTAMQTLTLGNSTTGNVVIAPGGVTALTGVGSSLTAAGALTVSGTFTANGVATIGDGGDTVTIDSSDWDISATGVMSNIGNIGMDGNLTITQTAPGIFMTDTGGDDYSFTVDANAYTIINSTDSRTELTFDGTGSIDLGDNTTTKTIDIGGNTSSAADTIRIGTNATAADTITIGNTGASTALALNDDNWNITGAGLANFVSIGAATPGTGAFTSLTSSGNTTLGTGASSINTIGSVTTPGTLTLHGATTLDNTFTVSGSNLTTLGGNLTVTGTTWTATPTISGLITATSGLTANGNLTSNANTQLGNAITDTIDFQARVLQDSDLIPITTTGTNDLGSASLPWDNVYATVFTQNGNLVCDASGANCPGSAANYWRLNAGTISPVNDTLDLLVGSNATASAKFAAININTGTPTATISANSGSIATYLTGDGTLATTNRQSLTLGNSTTYNTSGNILLHPNGTGRIGIGNPTPEHLVSILGSSANGTPLIMLRNTTDSGEFATYRNYLNSTIYNFGQTTGGDAYFALYEESGTSEIVLSPGNDSYTFGVNFGVGEKTPASLFTVGSGDLFQVNSSGIIASIDGVAHTIDDVSGNLTLTSNSTDVSVADGLIVAGNVLPSANETYNLGATGSRWNDLFLGGETLHIGTSLTDEGLLSYTTSTNVLSLATDATGNGNITLAPGGTTALTASSNDLTAADSLTVTGAFVGNGTIQLGNAITDTLDFQARVLQDADLIPITTTGTNDLGSSSLPWDNIYVNNLSYTAAGSITIADNTTNAYQLKEGSNVYLDITTTNDAESFTLNMPIGGATSHTANLFNANIAQTINIGTGTAVDTINIGTGGTSTDDINLGGLSTSHVDVTGIVNFAGGTTYFVDASGNAKFLDLQVADTGNPGLTVGNGTIGFIRVGGSTISDNSGNLTLDSDSAAITIASDDTTLTATGLATLDMAATVAWDVATLNASSLATLDTAATVAWDVATLNATSLGTLDASPSLLLATTTLTLDSNSTINGGSAANTDLTLQGTSNATRTTSYVLLQPTAGFVGIGTSNPTQELDVNGDIQISSATGRLYDTFVTAGISLGATNETALSGFGATSIVGALNELKNVDKNSSHNDYLSWANHYEARAEGSDLTDSEALNGLFFDTFADSTKIDGVTSTSSGVIKVADNSSRVGLMGSQTYNTSTTDNDGQTYLGSNVVNDIYFYDRTRDSSPEVLVELGIDPNWYNGVTLSVATGSANYSPSGTVANKNPNLTTSYNGSLIKATGTDSTPRTIFITIKTPTTFDWTNYQGDSASAVTITPGTAQTLGSTGVSVTFTATNYNVGDVFKIASWYIEPEGSTRGAKQQFPERSNIIAEGSGGTAYVSIVDADTQKLWMRFNDGLGYALGDITSATSSYMLNGRTYIGTTSSISSGGRVFNFTEDSSHYYGTTNVTRDQLSFRNTNVGNSGVVNTTISLELPNSVNDMVATVIPNDVTKEVTVSGWGYIIGDSGSASVTESVNLPYKFNSTPTININYANATSTTPPTSLASCTTGVNLRIITSSANIVNNGFTAILRDGDNTLLGATNYYCYTWTATGIVSPSQFVAVATGDSSNDGAVTIINETLGTEADVILGSQASNNIWNNKLAIANNSLYVAVNSNTVSTFTALEVWYGIHGLQTETSIGQYRTGYYYVQAQSGSYSTNGPVILGTASTASDIKSLSATAETSTIDGISNTIYIGTSVGVTVLQEKKGFSNSGSNNDGLVESSGTVKYYTKDYISEEMFGDIRGMWPLNNSNASSDFEDISIKANTLTGTNITAAGDSVTGVRNTATDFDGSTEYLSRADDADFDFSTEFSTSVWVKTTETDGTIWRKFQSSAEDKLLAMYTGGVVQFYLYNIMGGTSLFSTRVINDNNWHHIVASYDGTTAKIYIDGILDSSKAASGDIGDGTGLLYIGQNSAGASYYTGSIDELTISATVPTANQVKNMYQIGYRALQSHSTSLGSSTADSQQQLGYISTGTNTVGAASPDFNNQYMYVGLNSTTLGGVSKIQLNSDTNIKTFTASTNAPTGGSNIVDEDVVALGVGYQLETVGSAASGVKSMAPDNNASGNKGTLYSKTQTLSSSTKFAYLWASLYKDSSDLDSNIIVYACNAYATAALCTSNSAWVAGTSIQVDTTQDPPEQEFNFAFPTAGSSLTFKFDFYRDAADNKANTYLTRYGATWGSSVGGADIAERYESSEPTYPGDIVSISDQGDDGVATVELTRNSYDQKAIGVVTTNPGIVMDENLVDLNWNAASRNSPDRPAVALAGRVPVKVSTANGPIMIGDSITSSTIPGIGIKATQSGVIIGKALEKFDCTSPSAIPSDSDPTVCTGTVLTFVNIGHYEPIYYLSDAGEFIFSGHELSESEDASPSGSPIIRLVRVLADGSKEVVDRIGTFGSVISGSTKTQDLAVDTISPIASGSAIKVNGPVVIKPESDMTFDQPLLTVEGEIEASTISARVAELGQIRADKIVAGEIIADSITANSIIGLDARIASLSAGTSTNLSDSDISTITDRIKSRLADLTGSAPTAEDIPIEPSDPHYNNLAFSDLPSSIASDSATLANVSADFVTINNYLAVIGTATITTLDITSNFTTDSISSKNDLLAIQPLGGIVKLASNTLIIDSLGQVAINGDLTVSGSILADSASLNSLSLGSTATDSARSALGQLLAVYNEQGIQVASIDASGSANLAGLTTKLITIASGKDATSSGLLSTSTSSNSTAGESILVAPNTDLVIDSPFVTSHSLVYLTPTGNTDNKVLFIKSKTSCDQSPTNNACTPSFTVGIDSPASTDISFNWWIIELK